MKWTVGRWRLCRPVARAQPPSCRRICITAGRKCPLMPVCRQRLKLSASRLRMGMKCCCLDLSTAWPRPWIGWPAKPMGACRMALLDKGLKQRMVGALVLLALAVIFLPMLLSREDELRRVVVDAPSMPDAPAMPQIEMQPVVVPEPQILTDESLVAGDDIQAAEPRSEE